ncbi:Putative HTH-type transcriptional regulator TrmBL2 [Candidatus Tiddalikarchaeum anstoanum]|nr:Putative HTH-type transcriptional regulator TrmBL2 [Candidatus Tiddalikarchaeum anstoanum]
MVVNDPEILNELRNLFNLNLYEVKIWLALLSKGVSTAGELSDIANVPRSRTYDVLESLEKKNFVIMKLSKPIKYMAVKPDDVLSAYKKSLFEEAQHSIRSVEKVGEGPIMKELNLLYSSGTKNIEPHDISGVIKGRTNIYNRLESLIKNAKKDIILSTSAEGLVREVKSFKDLLVSAKKRGVTVRMVSPMNDEVKSTLKEVGSEVGTHRALNDGSRFIITDNNEALFLLIEDEKVHPKFELGLWVKSEAFAKSLNNMFNYMWAGLK